MFFVNHLIGFQAGGRVKKFSAAAEWNGASYTYSGDDVQSAANDTAARTNDSFKGDFEFQFTFIDRGTGDCWAGVYPVSADGSFNQSAAAAGVFNNAAVASFSIRFTSDTAFAMQAANTSEVTGQAVASGDVLKIVRAGSAVSLYKNGTLHRTWTATSTAELRIAIGDGGYTSASDNFEINDVSWSF